MRYLGSFNHNFLPCAFVISVEDFLLAFLTARALTAKAFSNFIDFRFCAFISCM